MSDFKYFNGSEYLDVSEFKRWDGTQWIDINTGGGGVNSARVVIFTRNGTFTTPEGINKVWLTGIGAGGSGGNGGGMLNSDNTGSNGSGGGGGGGGAYCYKLEFDVTPATNYDITVGYGNTIFGSLLTLNKGSSGGDGGINPNAGQRASGGSGGAGGLSTGEGIFAGASGGSGGDVIMGFSDSYSGMTGYAGTNGNSIIISGSTSNGGLTGGVWASTGVGGGGGGGAGFGGGGSNTGNGVVGLALPGFPYIVFPLGGVPYDSYRSSSNAGSGIFGSGGAGAPGGGLYTDSHTVIRQWLIGRGGSGILIIEW